MLKISVICLLTILSYSTLFSVSQNYTVTYQKSYKQLAHCYYEQKLNEQGLNRLSIIANGERNIIQQHRGAGFLEGYTTYNEIYNAYLNINQLLSSSGVNGLLQRFIDKQLNFLQQMSQKFNRDVYWQHIGAYVEQVKYMYRGYLQRIHEQNRIDKYIGFSQFYYLINSGEIRELYSKFINVNKTGENKKSTSFVKKINQQYFIAHSTINDYSSMLRIHKTYQFPNRNVLVGSQRFSFSSKPGIISSNDDFYIASSGLKVLETNLFNLQNPPKQAKNYQLISALSVPGWLRGLVATNLAKNSDQWIDYFKKYNSASNNNQWIIVNQNYVKSLQVVDQAFDLIKYYDLTKNLTEKGYLGFYNVPFDEQICKKLHYQNYQYFYQSDPRGNQLNAISGKISNIQDLKQQLLLNNQSNPKQGIAPRGDVDSNPVPYGLIDCKITATSTEKDNYYWAISGPTTNGGKFKPFDWSQFPSINHNGMPQLFNFTWQKILLNVQRVNQIILQ